MTLQDWATIAGMCAIIFSGINFVAIAIAKSFWNLTFKRLEAEVKADRELNATEKKVNGDFRHSYSTTLNLLADQMKHQSDDLQKAINHQSEVVDLKLQNIDSKITYMSKIVEKLENK
jgi:hypothetical protein